tara:strand:+ start:110 stop:958 length:849 start_codon:yes stop_codon:yes gene_type:complete
MPLYICKCCDYETKIKPHYNRHLNTNKHKKNGEKSIIIGPVRYSTNINMCEIQNINFMCDYCDKTFTSSSHLSRHKKNNCKIKEQQDIQKKELSELKQMFKEERERNQLERERYQEESKDLHKHINELIKKAGNTTNNTANITLNCYGHEDLSHITEDQKLEWVKLPYGMVQKMIEHVHFSNKRPENWNIKLTNKKDKMIKVFRGNKWKYQDKDEVVSELIQTNYCRLDDFYENIASNDLNKLLNTRYKKFQTQFDEDDDELKDKLMKESSMILLSENLQKK